MMDWMLGSISVAIVCGSVGVLLFVLMHMMAGSSPATSRDEVFADVTSRGEQRGEREGEQSMPLPHDA